jgi:hypothetical protein
MPNSYLDIDVECLVAVDREFFWIVVMEGKTNPVVHTSCPLRVDFVEEVGKQIEQIALSYCRLVDPLARL